MDFNRYVFDCYLATESAKKTKGFFDDLPNYIHKKSVHEMYSFLSQQSYTRETKEYWEETILFANNLLQDFQDWDKAQDIDQAIDHYDHLINLFLSEDNKKEYRHTLTWLDGISLFLYTIDPDYYLPYFFVNRFFLLEKVFISFSIPLPPPPSKQQYRERLFYYGSLCKILYEFRIRHSLSPTEMCAFLYDFSQKTLTEFITSDDLPEAINIYICGGTKADTEQLRSSAHNYQTFWQGNPQTKVGDIILLYSLAPYSALTAIFRSVSPAYYDPFSFYPDRVWVGFSINIPEIHLSKLKNNAIWQQKGLVKANMQGLNGRECSVAEYNAVLEILKEKEVNVSSLPSLPFWNEPNLVDLENEKDVELTLLEPLLKKLGFQEKDWLRQMTLRMGRGERVFPDYAIFANNHKGEEQAQFIWEAKYRIANKKQLE